MDPELLVIPAGGTESFAIQPAKSTEGGRLVSIQLPVGYYFNISKATEPVSKVESLISNYTAFEILHRSARAPSGPDDIEIIDVDSREVLATTKLYSAVQGVASIVDADGRPQREVEVNVGQSAAFEVVLEALPQYFTAGGKVICQASGPFKVLPKELSFAPFQTPDLENSDSNDSQDLDDGHDSGKDERAKQSQLVASSLPFTVSADKDKSSDAKEGSIRCFLQSADVVWAGLETDTVDLHLVKPSANTNPEIFVNTSSLALVVFGRNVPSYAAFSVSLSEPASDKVTLALSLSRAYQTTPRLVSFDAGETGPVEVVVSISDFDDPDIYAVTDILISPASSSDPRFQGIRPTPGTISIYSTRRGVLTVPRQVAVLEGALERINVELNSGRKPTAGGTLGFEVQGAFRATPSLIRFRPSDFDQNGSASFPLEIAAIGAAGSKGKISFSPVNSRDLSWQDVLASSEIYLETTRRGSLAVRPSVLEANRDGEVNVFITASDAARANVDIHLVPPKGYDPVTATIPSGAQFVAITLFRNDQTVHEREGELRIRKTESDDPRYQKITAFESPVVIDLRSLHVKTRAPTLQPTPVPTDRPTTSQPTTFPPTIPSGNHPIQTTLRIASRTAVPSTAQLSSDLYIVLAADDGQIDVTEYEPYDQLMYILLLPAPNGTQTPEMLFAKLTGEIRRIGDSRSPLTLLPATRLLDFMYPPTYRRLQICPDGKLELAEVKCTTAAPTSSFVDTAGASKPFWEPQESLEFIGFAAGCVFGLLLIVFVMFKCCCGGRKETKATSFARSAGMTSASAVSMALGNGASARKPAQQQTAPKVPFRPPPPPRFTQNQQPEQVEGLPQRQPQAQTVLDILDAPINEGIINSGQTEYTIEQKKKDKKNKKKKKKEKDTIIISPEVELGMLGDFGASEGMAVNRDIEEEAGRAINIIADASSPMAGEGDAGMRDLSVGAVEDIRIIVQDEGDLAPAAPLSSIPIDLATLAAQRGEGGLYSDSDTMGQEEDWECVGVSQSRGGLWDDTTDFNESDMEFATGRGYSYPAAASNHQADSGVASEVDRLVDGISGWSARSLPSSRVVYGSPGESSDENGNLLQRGQTGPIPPPSASRMDSVQPMPQPDDQQPDFVAEFEGLDIATSLGEGIQKDIAPLPPVSGNLSQGRRTGTIPDKQSPSHSSNNEVEVKESSDDETIAADQSSYTTRWKYEYILDAWHLLDQNVEQAEKQA